VANPEPDPFCFFFFFLGLGVSSSSSSSSSTGGGACFFGVGLEVRTSCSTTIKLSLHLGQMIFLPGVGALRTFNLARQLEHWIALKSDQAAVVKKYCFKEEVVNAKRLKEKGFII